VFSRQHAVAAETVAVKLIEIGYQIGTQGIQMDIAHQLQQVRVFLAENGLVAVLKQMPAAPVPQVEAHGVTRQKPPHDS
jgi:hypothetical protein